jgi:hypothetical protein
MTDSHFFFAGKIKLPEKDDFEKDLPQRGEFYERFIVITDHKNKGGFHHVVATPKAAKLARLCIKLNRPAFVSGHIKSYPPHTTILMATYIVAFEAKENSSQQDFSTLANETSQPPTPEETP